MNFQWAIVFFPIPEYSVCEDAVVLNIEIHRRGNVNISSYVTVTSIEQTAKESLDFVSRRINKIQFDPGISSTVWKIMIVQDNLEEAPIEQLQVILSDPENCLINQNRTIVSIYDVDRDACSQIPIEDPLKLDTDFKDSPKNTNTNTNFANEDTEDYKDEYESNNSGFPMACNQNIYGLLHFQQATQTLFQCNGRKWIPWFPSNSSNTVQLGTAPSSYSEEKERNINNVPTTTMSSKEIDISSDVTVIEYCPKGWEEYDGKCYKWHKQQSTWTNAQSICKSYISGNLVEVLSSDHNNWLLNLSKGKSFWIGLHVPHESSEWIYKVPKDNIFQNWKRGFPRSPVNGEVKHRCALVRASGHWINKNCDLHEHSYICSVEL